MTENKQPRGQLPGGQPFQLAGLLEYATDSVVSRTLAKNKAGNITLFSFDTGQGLSEHSAPYDAYVYILDGQAEITIGGNHIQAKTGEFVVMPANIPHSVQAKQPFKMLLVMIRG